MANRRNGRSSGSAKHAEGDERSGERGKEERSRREERAQRILDSASELIQRWGYNKTTIDDIAKHAHVAKGTIYLHWKTREELFEELMRREELRLSYDIMERLAADPSRMTLHGMVKYGMLATMKNPLMKAVLLRDTEILGTLVQQQYSNNYYKQSIEGERILLEFMRERGIIRDDISIDEELYMLGAVTWGFLLIEPLMPEEMKFSDEKIAELMADAVEHSLAPAIPPSEEEKQAASMAYAEYINNLMQMAVQELQPKEKEL